MWNDNSGLGRPPTTLLHPWQLKDKISHAACCLLPAEVFSNLRLETQPKTTENSASFDSWWPPEATAERPGALCSVFATPLHRLKSTLQHFSTVHPELLVGFLSRFQYPSIHCWRKPAMCSIYICRLSIEGYSPTHTYYCSYIMFCTQCVYAAYKVQLQLVYSCLFLEFARALEELTAHKRWFISIYTVYCSSHLITSLNGAIYKEPASDILFSLVRRCPERSRSATLCRTACGTRDLRWGLPRLLMRQSIFRYAPEWGRMDRSTGHNRSIFEHVWTLNMSNRLSWRHRSLDDLIWREGTQNSPIQCQFSGVSKVASLPSDGHWPSIIKV